MFLSELIGDIISVKTHSEPTDEWRAFIYYVCFSSYTNAFRPITDEVRID